MTFTPSCYRKRSIALTMLFVWVFALCTGVANACLTEPRGELMQSGGPITLHEHVLGATAHGSEDAAEPQLDHHPDKAPCWKACDESSQTLLKLASKFDTSSLQFLVLPTRPWGDEWLQAPAILARTAVAAVPPPSPPAWVRFSRLAL